jgi:hypothetical protein
VPRAQLILLGRLSRPDKIAQCFRALIRHPHRGQISRSHHNDYDNVGRKLTNTEFVALVGNAWVGTTIPQSQLLEEVIRDVVAIGKTATFAIKHSSESRTGGPPAIRL